MPLFSRRPRPAPRAGSTDPARPQGAPDLRTLLPAVRAEAERHRCAGAHALPDATSTLVHRHTADPLDAAVGAIAIGAAAARLLLEVDLHDPQLLCGLGLATGHAVELRTGEGKTFAAIGPALLFGAVHGSVHVVTANPYLAERDADWSGRAIRAAGLTTGVTLPGRPRADTRRAYAADVVFGAGSDFGFDHLRDQLVLPGDAPVQRGRRAAIVDEIDAVLLDAARTPLVLSGSAFADVEAVRRADAVVRTILSTDDPRRSRLVEVDPLHGHVELTDAGIDAAEAALGLPNLYAGQLASDWPHLLRNALRARLLLDLDADYVVSDGRIAVVDDLTGRVLPGRRWSDGLHQAVEAKEGLEITVDRRPLGRVTVGNYFAAYEVLAGMSGTLHGAEDELRRAYGLPTITLPTHRPNRRIDHTDLVVADAATRDAAIADDTAARHRRRQPVLVGTVSIRQARTMSRLLADRAVSHRVLTATNDAEEAAIIAGAGRAGAVTVATQMAGRGVDIVLDGGLDPDVGLMVWGVEHHPARRLDGQLRGRSGRQGDPGESRFADLAGAASVEHRQRELEDLDAAARRDVRILDGPIDALHDLLHQWRRAAADPAQLPVLLEEAVGRTYARRPAADVRVALERRRDREVGADRWDEVTSAVLRDLLVVLWSDALDHLETAKSLMRIGQLFGAHRRAWTQQVESRWASFRIEVQRAWTLQLLGARVEHRDASTGAPAPAAATPLPPRPVTTADGGGGGGDDCGGDDATADEDGYDHEWDGFSLNQWWRRHCGMFPPDPPLVLELDAIGDAAPGGVRVHLDHDDPTRSRIVLDRRSDENGLRLGPSET